MNASVESPGSTTHQIVLFTTRISHLTKHMHQNKKDYSAKKGLLDMVSKRHRLLKYLYRKDSSLYNSLCEELSLRK